MNNVENRLDYTLTWSAGRGAVSSANTLFDTDEKPNVGFTFDALYYETTTGLSFKVVEGVQLSLSTQEIVACRTFCESFADTADYPVQAYEPETGLYSGLMLKSLAQAQGLAWVLGAGPEDAVSRLVNDEWQRVVAVFMDDGRYRLLPDSTCPRCILFLTQAEWDAWPKPVKSTEVWDFATEKWKDYRTLEQAQKTADEYIRSAYAIRRTAVMGAAPYPEMATWPWQVAEAEAFALDPAVPTPFLDGMLIALDDTKTKAELAASILKYNSPEYRSAAGKVHGEMYGWLTRLRAADTLESVDATTADMAQSLAISPLIRPLTGL